MMNKDNPRKHGRSSEEPIVEDPDDEPIERRSKHMARRNDTNQMQHVRLQPEVNSFTFQSSSVSYGGANGAFYTSSRTRRSGSEGLSYEEFREADSSTRQATHSVSKGIHDKQARRHHELREVDTPNCRADSKLIPWWRRRSIELGACSSRDMSKSQKLNSQMKRQSAWPRSGRFPNESESVIPT